MGSVYIANCNYQWFIYLKKQYTSNLSYYLLIPDFRIGFVPVEAAYLSKLWIVPHLSHYEPTIRAFIVKKYTFENDINLLIFLNLKTFENFHLNYSVSDVYHSNTYFLTGDFFSFTGRTTTNHKLGEAGL